MYNVDITDANLSGTKPMSMVAGLSWTLWGSNNKCEVGIYKRRKGKPSLF